MDLDFDLRKMHEISNFNTQTSHQSNILPWIRVRDNYHSPNHQNNLKSKHFRSGQQGLELDPEKFHLKR